MLRLAFASGDRPPLPAGGREVNAWRSDSGAVFARLFANGRHRWVTWPGLGVFAFSPDSDEVRVWCDPGVSHDVLTETFGRAIQPAVLQALGWQALHASGVIVNGQALLLCGRSRSGKSTLAFALARAGHAQFADDAVTLDLHGPTVQVHPLPFLPRLREPSRAHFPDAPIEPEPARPFPAAAPLAAIVDLGQVEGLAAPVVERVPAPQAFAIVLAHAHSFDPTDPAETRRLTEDYLRVVHDVPVWTARFAPGLEELPKLQEIVLSLVSSGPPTANPRPRLVEAR